MQQISSKHKLSYKERVLLAQRLYNFIVKYDTWNLTMVKEPPTFAADMMGIPVPMVESKMIRINFEIDTGGESGPTPYVRGEPQA